MPELIPGGDVTRGLLEAQLHKLGLRFNADYFLVQVGGQWVLSLSEDNYRRWVASHDADGSADGDTEASDGTTEDEAPHEPPAESGDPDVADPETEDPDADGDKPSTKDNRAPQPKRSSTRKGR